MSKRPVKTVVLARNPCNKQKNNYYIFLILVKTLDHTITIFRIIHGYKDFPLYLDHISIGPSDDNDTNLKVVLIYIQNTQEYYTDTGITLPCVYRRYYMDTRMSVPCLNSTF